MYHGEKFQEVPKCVQGDCFKRCLLFFLFLQVNLAFCSKLLRSISPVPFFGPKTRLLLSSTASRTFFEKARSVAKSAASIHSLRDGIPKEIEGGGDVCVLVAPSSPQDYRMAKAIASGGQVKAIVMVNGLAKASCHTTDSALNHNLLIHYEGSLPFSHLSISVFLIVLVRLILFQFFFVGSWVQPFFG